VDGADQVNSICIFLLCGQKKKNVLIRLVPHSSHLAQPLDLCVFGLFQIIYRKDKKKKKKKNSKGMKGETRKIYRALLAFYKSTTMSMVRWSFERAGFCLNPANLLGPLTIDPRPALGRLEVPELSFDDAFVDPD
jgi:hypothetical protein